MSVISHTTVHGLLVTNVSYVCRESFQLKLSQSSVNHHPNDWLPLDYPFTESTPQLIEPRQLG